MKKSIYCLLFLSLVAFTAQPAGAKTVVTTLTGVTDKATDNANATDMPGVFADNMASLRVPTFDINTNNIFADDMFTDDVITDDVLMVNVVANNEAIIAADITTLESNADAQNGTLSTNRACIGKLNYYTEPHTDKAGNIIAGGQNTLYVKKVLSSGVYLCMYAGADGSTKDVKVVCKL